LWRQCRWYVVAAATSTTANFNAGDSSHPGAGKLANADPHFKHDHDHRSVNPLAAIFFVVFSGVFVRKKQRQGCRKGSGREEFPVSATLQDASLPQPSKSGEHCSARS
jgi:hypothetical protein